MAEKSSRQFGALGRGLGALLGDAAVRAPEGGSVMLRITEVEPRSDQPRQIFDDEALTELSESIKLHGILQPLAVRRLSSGYYQIIAGERRWRAARLAGLQEVPALVFEADDKRATELALIENLQREDLNPIEEADGFRVLIEEYGLTQEEAAVRVGRSRPAVANSLRLLSLPESVRAMLTDGRLSPGHARALLSLPGKGEQERIARKIVSEGLNVRQTEALTRRLQLEKPKKERPRYVEEYERRLSGVWGRKVTITAGRSKGRIELEFYNPKDLESVVQHLEKLRISSGSDDNA